MRPPEGAGSGATRQWGGAERIISSYHMGEPGPTVVACGGMHGNEPAGLMAGIRVVDLLARTATRMAGRLVVVAGNRPALAAGCRFLDRDMNRRWTAGHLRSLAARAPHERCREDNEQLALEEAFEDLHATSQGSIVYLDLHSTSGEAQPFVVILETPENRGLAEDLPLPVILELERHIDAPSMTWWVERGHAALGIEGGLHEDPATVDHLEDAIWAVLESCGCLGARPPSARAAQGDQVDVETRTFRVAYRHAVVPGAGFAMEPGYASFDGVRMGRILAHEHTGPVRAALDGHIFLPRYQDQGGDGFFLIVPASSTDQTGAV